MATIRLLHVHMNGMSLYYKMKGMHFIIVFNNNENNAVKLNHLW